MIDKIKQDAEHRMSKSVESLRNELVKLRTGRAHPSLLEHITVDYYGNRVPLSQVATITTGDARTLQVSPWEKNMVETIDKAIRSSDLGLNPNVAGQIIRVPLPPLTEQRRKDMIKIVRGEGENAKVAIRNVRRDANNHIKDLLKAKSINEDEERRSQDNIQKMTDKFIAEVDKILATKEADLMEL